MSMEDSYDKGRLLSQEIGQPLYNALRVKIMTKRETRKMKEEEERGKRKRSEDKENCWPAQREELLVPETEEEVSEQLQNNIAQLDYVRRVRRGMLLRLKYLEGKENHSE